MIKNNSKTRRCYRCKTEKPVSDFYFETNRMNYSRRCKQCDNELARINKAKNNYYRTPKHEARTAVANAVRSGALERQPCEQCGYEDAQAHHYKGYDEENWLEVQWLCYRHHKLVHHPLSEVKATAWWGGFKKAENIVTNLLDPDGDPQRDRVIIEVLKALNKERKEKIDNQKGAI